MTRQGPFWSSFGCAAAGVAHALRTQRNVRIHLAATIAATALAALLNVSPLEWALLCLTIAMVWAAELINTAIEAVVDLASPEQHPLARIAKDTAAGAVLVTAGNSVLIAVVLFGPRLWALLR
ncbi:MAG: diacylglycerol kinase family protein [Planctomycetaceae bacterium]|nr:diacylglycerol kinase family protein [Planctomycetaceae bacterium]